jgi:hypothetical protein
MRVVLLGLCLSIGLNASFAATITGGSQEAIVGGHWTSNYGSDGYALFGTAPNNDVPGIFSPSGGQTVFDFSAQLSNGQTAQTLLSVPSYVNGLTSLQLTSIKEGYNYTLIDNPLGGAQIASGNA